MAYPQYFERTYVNPSGNIAASGYYVSYITQEISNKYPQWHAVRDNVDSVGQQFISPFAKILRNLEKDMNEDLNNNYISLAPVDDVDVLYRMRIPSAVSFLDNPNIECWTAPSGATPSGYPFYEGSDPSTNNQIQATPVTDLEEFYYHLIPTRIKAFNEETLTDQRLTGIGISIPVNPSGIVDPKQKYVDRAKKEHDLTWARDDGETVTEIHRQDSESLESYETYDVGASGYIQGFTLYKDYLWWVGHVGTSEYFLNLSNPNPAPDSEYLDHIASYDITALASGSPPSGVAVDEEGMLWITDEDRRKLYALTPMYDYFLVDKENRFVYFREDYSNPGVFVKTA